MSASTIALLVFICCFGAALIGLYIRLPPHHLDSDFKDTVRLVTALIATMSALVLGLLISSANTTYETQAAELQQMSTDIAQLDRMLVLYGPETRELQDFVRKALTAAHQRIWPADRSQPVNLDPLLVQTQSDAFYQKLLNLTPKTAAQTRAQDAAWQLASSITQLRVLIYEQRGGSISWPLLTVLIFWVSVLFLGFGLFSRTHVTLIVVLIVGAMSVAGAIFLILELNQPYAGLIRLSDAPIRSAIESLER